MEPVARALPGGEQPGIDVVPSTSTAIPPSSRDIAGATGAASFSRSTPDSALTRWSVSGNRAAASEASGEPLSVTLRWSETGPAPKAGASRQLSVFEHCG